ncbi:secreted ookinete protein, putative [Babesia ovis]|uniref:Secreted ookinete protein, putative n=1 Tax=Babesia ovis TaxID=5869 RepID=A0A9W5TD50_BABOV|nr:secreted ookinete protein, putative [Babesia ovis]
MRNAVMSGIQDSADFAIKIHPPVQDVDETLRSLDGIMMMEDAERRASNEDFVDAEQRLLALHKAKIREIVAAALEPIHAMFPVGYETLMNSEAVI